MEMTARLGLKVTKRETLTSSGPVEMEMTARLGLKDVLATDPLDHTDCRNGDDSPVGIESGIAVLHSHPAKGSKWR